MALNESTQSTFGILWLMIMAIIVCIFLKSPWVILFAFIFVFNFLGLVKSFTDGTKKEHGEDDAVDEVELQPLEKMDIKNMTLGELLDKY